MSRRESHEEGELYLQMVSCGVQLIDPKLTNNRGIILASLRMSYDDMAKAVEKM